MTVNLGDIVQYQPADPSAAPIPAIVMTVHEDGKADVKALNGYCLGMTDVEKVDFSDEVAPGKVSKLGAKPKESKDAPKAKSEAK